MAEEGWPRAAELYGGAPWWCGRVNSDGEVVAVPLACARWRGRQGEASDAGELDRVDGRGTSSTADHGLIGMMVGKAPN